MATNGETRVGVDFNPSNKSEIYDIKRKAADLIDAVGRIDPRCHATYVDEWKGEAVKHIETASMFAVKAAVYATKMD